MVKQTDKFQFYQLIHGRLSADIPAYISRQNKTSDYAGDELEYGCVRISYATVQLEN